MFDGIDLKNLNLGDMLNKFQDMAKEQQEKSSQNLFTAKAGGGMVEISINGNSEVVDLKIDDSLLEDKDSLQILLISCMNDIIKQSEENKKRMAMSLMGNLGGLGNLGQKQMKELLEKFEDYLLNNLPKIDTFHPHFENAMQDMLKAGGKRFRPMLLLSVVNSKKPLLVENSLKVALAVEFLHTYSLVHDDLPSMDNADLRRGFTTLHKKYDEVTAILVGDALNSESFNLIANSSLHNDIKIELIKLLAENGGLNGMIIGQAIDCYFEKQILELEKLEFLHIHKTAKLIASSLKMGAIISNYDEKIQEELYNFGLDIGLLFQIQDDIIDELESSEIAGKTTKNDSLKNSFVNLLGLEESLKSADNLATKCLETMNSFDKNLKDSLWELLINYINRHKKYNS